MITQAQLKELLDYDPETGIFVWIKNKKIAGNSDHGYIRIMILKKNYYAHRLAWLYMTGEFPNVQIDHRDTIGSHNNWSNLRVGTQSQNLQNRKVSRADNKIGLLGVSPHKDKFVAQIMIEGKQTYLGLFDNPQDAHAVYLKTKREHHEFCTI